MEENKDRRFCYTYSAKERVELKRIREKYSEKTEDKMEQVRRLDAQTTKKARTASIFLGIVGVLIMGGGMSLVMTDLGASLAIAYSLPVGIAVGVFGMALAALSYPVYTHIVKKEREKIAPVIIRLTDELMG